MIGKAKVTSSGPATHDPTLGPQVPCLYHIDGWLPLRGMGQSGFNIKLYPAMKGVWASRGLTQKDVDGAIGRMEGAWLKAFGWGELFQGHFLHRIQVRCGEWGIENIDVPGNACGIDLCHDSSMLWAPKDGRLLVPHNVDSPEQAGLLLAVFLFFMNDLMLHLETGDLK